MTLDASLFDAILDHYRYPLRLYADDVEPGVPRVNAERSVLRTEAEVIAYNRGRIPQPTRACCEETRDATPTGASGACLCGNLMVGRA